MLLFIEFYMNFYCIFLKRGEEEAFKKKALKILAESAPEARIYFFTEDAWEGRAKKGIKVVRPAFPGYLFLAIEELTDGLVLKMSKIKGFIRFLPETKNIQKMDSASVEILSRFLFTGEHHKMSTAVYAEGDKVRITGGDIKEFEGYITRFDLRHQKVYIRLPNQWMSMEFELSYEITIQKLED